jgi:L-lactate dehydrogenase complex protein LldF
MKPAPQPFAERAAAALANPSLRRALTEGPQGFVDARARATAAYPGFESLRHAGRDIKDHALANLDFYLEAFERAAEANGTQVHWAATAADANDIILGICRSAGARLVTKSKSMVSEEIGLGARLEAAALEVVDTDLGDYTVQIRGEPPSHIMAPAIHVAQEDIADDFRRRHQEFPADRDLSTAEALVSEARSVLRQKFLAADVGITGANFLVASTGSAIVVTNEGNADLTMTLPRVHVVITTIEKVVPTLDDAWTLLRLLARSGTGQAFTAYTTLVTGPRRAGDPDGPEASHVVLLDNGRSEILASQMREVLRCIRCGACLNHCPVYCAVGGHAYASVYPGPIGAVLTPTFAGREDARELSSASTFCGRCEAVCPVEIPLVGLMRRWRETTFASQRSRRQRLALRAWAYLALRPRAYHLFTRIASALLAAAGRSRGALRSLPLASGWTRHRDLPSPHGQTFQAMWQQRRGRTP